MRTTPLDLSPEAQAVFGKILFRAMDENPGLSFEDAYAVLLNLWGLDCPHVSSVPVRGGSECLICRSVVVRV